MSSKYTIKPLEWRGKSPNWFADSPFCNYSVSFDKYPKRYYSFAPGSYRWHRSLDAAKANCERHYRTQLLKSLEPTR